MITRRLAALAAVAMLVAACSSVSAAAETANGYGGELQATRWVLQSYASAGVLVVVTDDQYADADFRAGRVKGFSGCNEYDAVYRNGGRLLLVAMPASTLMSCGEAADAFESAYMGLLLDSRFYNVHRDTLTIRGGDGTVLLVFDAAPVNPLLGPWVVDSYATTPNSLNAPLAGTELTAVFRLRDVGGSAGCNTYAGSYTLNGNLVAIGPLATTRMACDEAIMAQETSFLAALQGVGRVEPRGRTLHLQNLAGSTVVVLVRPSAEPAPSASASAGPSASARPSRSPTPSATPSAAPSATPTAAPTATPTPARTPVATGSPAPTVAPPASLPPTATCQLNAATSAGTVPIATIVYPADWNTVTEPEAQACRYFDPEPITVPADPATLTTAVMVKADMTVSYEDALAAATNPAAWNVLRNEPVTVSGLPATRLEATSTTGSPGYPVGVTRYAYLIDLGGGSAWIETSGTVGDATYVANTSVVDLMASQSTITAPAPS